MPQETKVQPGSAADHAERATLQGWTVDLADPALALDALEKAFDFRGDITVALDDGSAVTGYIFDRRRGTTLGDSYVRLMLPSGEKVRVDYDRIRRLEFGKDAAHGKSFETWVKKYVEKKLAGEKASIESEHLD